MQNVQREIERLVFLLKKDQCEDGSWAYAFETGITTDAYMIILLKILEIEDQPLIKALVDRIESKQELNGAWKLFNDEKEGNITPTVEAYYALLYSGLRTKNEQHMRLARQFIQANGGLKKVSMFTKFMLTLTGQMKWPSLFPIPLEAALLPPSFLVSMYDLSIYARSNLLPLLITANKKYQIKMETTPNLKDLSITRNEEDWEEELRSLNNRSLFSTIQTGVKNLIGLPGQLHSMAVDGIKKYMLERIEPDGTFYNYFSATFFMIFSLLSLGYSKKDPLILKAVEGLKSMACPVNGQTHMQYTTAHVWNTALISHALQESGLPADDKSIRLANSYLLTRQHFKYGDWLLHNAEALPGGWGFSDLNTINPDLDDTTAALRALYPSLKNKPKLQNNWNRGLSFVQSMQNDDGGFPAFEKNVNQKWLTMLPMKGLEFILTDPSTPDLTGRTLEFLGKYANLKKPNLISEDGSSWLFNHQEKDGSWYGRWSICYIYGTWAALTGLSAIGESIEHQGIKRAAKWLKSIQNDDGGWGESCYSDIQRKYVPLHASTLTHTAWAVDALISISPTPTPVIEKGISYLVREAQTESWTNHYPTGQGMANFFYIHYHSYSYLFPLITLSHYREKYSK